MLTDTVLYIGKSVRIALAVPGVVLALSTIIVMAKFCGKLSVHLKLVLNQCILDLVFALYVIIEAKFENFSYCVNYPVVLCLYTPVVLVCCNSMLIALEMFIAVKWPLQYTRIVTHRRVNLAIMGKYLLMGLVNVVIVVAGFVLRSIQDRRHTDTSSENTCSDLSAYFFLILKPHLDRSVYVFVASCFVVLVSVYSYIFHTIRRSSSDRSMTTKNLRKSAVTSFCVVLSFVVSIGLYFIIDFIDYMTENHLHFSERIDWWIVKLSMWCLVPFNSIFDALIYAIRLKAIREGYKKAGQWIKNIFCLEHKYDPKCQNKEVLSKNGCPKASHESWNK